MARKHVIISFRSRSKKQKQKVIDAITKTEAALAVALDTYEAIEETILEADND